MDDLWGIEQPVQSSGIHRDASETGILSFGLILVLAFLMLISSSSQCRRLPCLRAMQADSWSSSAAALVTLFLIHFVQRDRAWLPSFIRRCLM